MPKWMDGIDALAPGRPLPSVCCSLGEPQSLILTVGAAAGLAQLGLPTGDAVVSLIMFVVLASITIALPVIYYLVGGDRAHATLDSLKAWLTVHNNTVMAVLFLVFGVNLIANAIPPLTA